MFDSGVILWGEIRSSSLSGGVLGFSVLRFWLFLRLAFRSLCQKTSVFPIWVPFLCDLSSNYASPLISNSPKKLCMLHLSPLYQIDQGFDHKDVEIFKTVLHAVFGFDPIFLRLCGFGWLRLLIDPDAPLPQRFNRFKGVNELRFLSTFNNATQIFWFRSIVNLSPSLTSKSKGPLQVSFILLFRRSQNQTQRKRR